MNPVFISDHCGTTLMECNWLELEQSFGECTEKDLRWDNHSWKRWNQILQDKMEEMHRDKLAKEILPQKVAHMGGAMKPSKKRKSTDSSSSNSSKVARGKAKK